MNNELMSFDEIELNPTELGGNGLSGNGISECNRLYEFDLYLSELSF